MTKKILICLLFLASCTRLGTLGTKKHRFGDLPTKIVWLQVGGLSEEHLAMLHFYRPVLYESLSFAKARCIGKIWNYNLFTLRPNSFDSFFAQMTGKKNIKGDCSDFKYRPLWSYLKNKRTARGVFEYLGTNQESDLFKASNCDKSRFLSNLVLWKMAKAPKGHKNFFHLQEKVNFQDGNIYYDQSCQKGHCYNSLSRNIEMIYQNYFEDKNEFVFVIRDFTYEEALQKKDMKTAREKLVEIEKIYDYFANEAIQNKQFLFLMTTAAPQEFEFPKQGKDWHTFEKKSKPVLYHSTSLQGLVTAIGARAENFCGIYEEAEILKRIIGLSSQSDFDY